MIKSMTGFGRAEKDLEWARIVFEIHSLNKRSFEMIFNLPRVWLQHEVTFREIMSKLIHRGRVTVSLECIQNQMQGEFCVNLELAREYKGVLEKLIKGLDLNDELKLRDFVQNKDIVFYQKNYVVSKTELKSVIQVLEEALKNFISMRRAEGARIHKELVGRIDNIEKNLHGIEKIVPQSIKRFEDRIRKRLEELFPTKEDLDIRVLREVALMAERLDITEEIVRMKSHIEQFSNTICGDGPVGRILDFIVQELLRETNTLGAKADDIETSRKVIEIKNELDKIREQVQNVE